MQDTFLKAFQHIGSFQQRAKFSTWLVSIASNTAIQRIRDRKDMETLDDSGFESDDGSGPGRFRPGRMIRRNCILGWKCGHWSKKA